MGTILVFNSNMLKEDAKNIVKILSKSLKKYENHCFIGSAALVLYDDIFDEPSDVDVIISSEYDRYKIFDDIVKGFSDYTDFSSSIVQDVNNISNVEKYIHLKNGLLLCLLKTNGTNIFPNIYRIQLFRNYKHLFEVIAVHSVTFKKLKYKVSDKIKILDPVYNILSYTVKVDFKTKPNKKMLLKLNLLRLEKFLIIFIILISIIKWVSSLS